jgi:hypothetical protein
MRDRASRPISICGPDLKTFERRARRYWRPDSEQKLAKANRPYVRGLTSTAPLREAPTKPAGNTGVDIIP